MSTAAAVLAPSVWRLAARQMARDFRAGELRLLVVAVMLAVAALAAVGFFADRINAGLARVDLTRGRRSGTGSWTLTCSRP